MRRSILSLALAPILTLALATSAFASGKTESTYHDIVTVSNVTSTSTVHSWDDKEEQKKSEEFGADILFGDVATYYCDAAPVTVNIKKDESSNAILYVNWYWDDDDVKTPPTKKLKEGKVYDYTSYYGSVTINSPGTYFFVAENVEGAEAGPEAHGFYVVVGSSTASTPAKTPATTTPTTTPSTKPTPATPSNTKLVVNGNAVAGDAYLINGNNYIKLRDIAAMVNGTEKNFEVRWDEAHNAINLVSGTAYTPTGGELTKVDDKAKSATPTTSKIYIDGKEVKLTAYTIGGSSFFKLRDVMQAFNIYLGWDATTSTATLDTSKGFVAP